MAVSRFTIYEGRRHVWPFAACWCIAEVVEGRWRKLAQFPTRAAAWERLIFACRTVDERRAEFRVMAVTLALAHRELAVRDRLVG